MAGWFVVAAVCESLCKNPLGDTHNTVSTVTQIIAVYLFVCTVLYITCVLPPETHIFISVSRKQKNHPRRP
jgi:hypothetical protein